MGNQKAMLEKIMRTPTATDIKPEELKSFMKWYGFELKRTSGSHYFYAFPNVDSLVIPMHSTIKPAYIDQIRKRIIEIEGEQND